MSNHLLPSIAYGIAVIFLFVRLYTKEKRDFIISISFVLLGSAITSFDLGFTVLYYFLGAIALSFIGDLLMAKWIGITEHRTLDGIMAFGLAHIVYILAFNQLNIGGYQPGISPDGRVDLIITIIGAVTGIVIYRVVASGPDLHIAIKVSNAVYALIITAMMIVVLSFVFTETTPMVVKLTAGTGVLLFIISDSILAFNEFQKPLPKAKEIIAVTYILAQILLQLTPLLTLNLQ